MKKCKRNQTYLTTIHTIERVYDCAPFQWYEKLQGSLVLFTSLGWSRNIFKATIFVGNLRLLFNNYIYYSTDKKKSVTE